MTISPSFVSALANVSPEKPPEDQGAGSSLASVEESSKGKIKQNAVPACPPTT